MGLNQPLAGKVEPKSPSWRSATVADRAAFYEQAGRLAVRQKREELRRGIGSNGRKMQPRKRPRRDGANGPVMDPHDDRSRTIRLLDARAWAAGVTLFWHSGMNRITRTPWGTILGYHAAGKVKGAPVRDVRLSTRGINAVRAAMELWWAEKVASSSKAKKPRIAREAAAAPARRPGKAPAGPRAKPPKNPKHVSAPGSDRPLNAVQEALARKYRGLRKYLRNPEEDF